MSSTKPADPYHSRRHCSTDSFGGIYSDKENEIFLQLARSVFEDDDDESVGTSFSDCAFIEKRMDFRDENNQCRKHVDQVSQPPSVNQARHVTFGRVCVYEFMSEEAPMMASKTISKTNVAEEGPLACSAFDKDSVSSLLSPATTERSSSKRQRRIRLSTQKFVQHEVGKHVRESCRALPLDNKPRLPSRSTFDIPLAQ